MGTLGEAERVVRFSQPIDALLDDVGEMPLPPYIHERAGRPGTLPDGLRRRCGSAAAPTAGLHFTPELLLALRGEGRALRSRHARRRARHVPAGARERHRRARDALRTRAAAAEEARLINETKLAGGRVIAVGTTAARTLETAAILSAGGDPAHPDANPDACAWRPVIAFRARRTCSSIPAISGAWSMR